MMRLQSTILLALTLALSLVSGAPAQPAADALSERQQTCPFGQVVRLWVEERTEINLKGVIDHLKGGPGVYSDFAFSEGDHEQETFALYTYADGADPAGRPTAKYVVRTWSRVRACNARLMVSVTSTRPMACPGTASRSLSAMPGLSSRAARTRSQRCVLSTRWTSLCPRSGGRAGSDLSRIHSPSPST